jgi:hypothetical protein
VWGKRAGRACLLLIATRDRDNDYSIKTTERTPK